MTTAVVALISVALAAVAAAGILRPFGRSGTVAMERLSDPLEDERSTLLRTLRDLDDERATGAIDEPTYESLRARTETRAVAVLRAIEARDGDGTLATGMKEVRVATSPSVAADADPQPAPARNRRATVPVIAVGIVLAVGVAVLLAGSISKRGSNGAITGDTDIGGPTAGAAGSDLAFFEQRVRAHPNDVAARLDLATRYADAGATQLATQQYLAALQLDPQNVEARAALGFLIYQSGKPTDGLKLVQGALSVAPNDPEALYDEGIILLKGLHRSSDAAVAFRAYLVAAPFGAHRAEVQSLLDAIAAGATTTATASPTPSA